MTGISTTRAVERCERLEKLGPPPPQGRPWKLRQWLRAYRAIMALDISVSAEMLRTLYTPSVVAEMANLSRGVPIDTTVDAVPGRRWIDPVTYEDP